MKQTVQTSKDHDRQSREVNLQIPHPLQCHPGDYPVGCAGFMDPSYALPDMLAQ